MKTRLFILVLLLSTCVAQAQGIDRRNTKHMSHLTLTGGYGYFEETRKEHFGRVVVPHHGGNVGFEFKYFPINRLYYVTRFNAGLLRYKFEMPYSVRPKYNYEFLYSIDNLSLTVGFGYNVLQTKRHVIFVQATTGWGKGIHRITNQNKQRTPGVSLYDRDKTYIDENSWVSVFTLGYDFLVHKNIAIGASFNISLDPGQKGSDLFNARVTFLMD